MDKDLIIGAVDKYNFDNIKHWANSIDRSGFTGKKAIIAYNMDVDTVKTLNERGFIIFALNKDNNGNLVHDSNTPGFNIVVERFIHMWQFLNFINEEIDYVISTDVRDVVFQTNPSEMLRDVFDENGSGSLLVGAENFRYKDEPWNVNNMNTVFGPRLLQHIADRPIYCAGVIAGRRKAFADFCLNIYLLCRGSSAHTPGGGGPDQAAMNILLNMDAYEETALRSMPHDNLIVHLGTTLPAIMSGSGEIGFQYKNNPNLLDTFKQSMLYSETQTNSDGTVTNGKGEPYCIVHQYDRVTGLKEIIHKKFGE